MATLILEQPLPRGEDLPYEDGEPLESDWHRLAMNLLIDILKQHWQGRRDFYAAGNMFVYFDPNQVRTRNFRGPDFFVVKGVASNHIRHSWVVWEEHGLTPDYVIELGSQSTIDFDLDGKRKVYERQLMTPEYVVYDPDTFRLRGWRRNPRGRFAELAPNARGWLWSDQLRLWLGVVDHQFPAIDQALPTPRFFDANGELVPTGEETQARRAEAEARRAETEARRAETEARRADEEAQARRAVEAELAQIKAELARKSRAP